MICRRRPPAKSSATSCIERGRGGRVDMDVVSQLRQEGHLSLQGQRLEYRMTGPGPDQAPTIVLLHEGLGCVAMWRDFPDQLAEATGCGVFAYSRQGYGGSSPCALPRPLEYMHLEAQSVLPKLLREIGFRRGFLLGHSDGGSIAAIHAGSTPAPGMLGLILLAPHFFTEDVGIQAIAETTELFRHGDLRPRLARHHGDNLDCAFNGWSDSWLNPAFRNWDLTPFLTPFLPHIGVPVLHLQGDRDPYGTAAQYECLQRECGAPVSVNLIQGCGHAPHRERPRQTLDAIRAFIQRHLKSK